MLNLSENELLAMNGQQVEVETSRGRSIDTVQVLTLPLQPELGKRIYFEHCGHIGISWAFDVNDCILDGSVIVRIPDDKALAWSEVMALNGQEVEVETVQGKARGVVRVDILPDVGGAPVPVVRLEGCNEIGINGCDYCNDAICSGEITVRRIKCHG